MRTMSCRPKSVTEAKGCRSVVCRDIGGEERSTYFPHLRAIGSNTTDVKQAPTLETCRNSPSSQSKVSSTKSTSPAPPLHSLKSPVQRWPSFRTSCISERIKSQWPVRRLQLALRERACMQERTSHCNDKKNREYVAAYQDNYASEILATRQRSEHHEDLPARLSTNSTDTTSRTSPAESTVPPFFSTVLATNVLSSNLKPSTEYKASTPPPVAELERNLAPPMLKPDCNPPRIAMAPPVVVVFCVHLRVAPNCQRESTKLLRTFSPYCYQIVSSLSTPSSHGPQDISQHRFVERCCPQSSKFPQDEAPSPPGARSPLQPPLLYYPQISRHPRPSFRPKS